MTAQIDALVRDLQADPAAASALRQVILGEDFVTASHVDAQFGRVGRALDRLTEAQSRTEAKIEQLTVAQSRTEAKIEQLTVAQSRTEAKIEQLTVAQSRTEAKIEQLTVAQGRTEAKFAQLVETQAQTSANVQALVAVVSKHDDRLGTMDDRMFELDAERKGPALLVVEASVTLNHDDVDRARRRADLMARATAGDAFAVWYGTRAHPAVLRAARSAGVWMVVGGHMIAPDPA